MHFFALIAEHQEVNKMTPTNLAVVIAPNLLFSNSDNMG